MTLPTIEAQLEYLRAPGAPTAIKPWFAGYDKQLSRGTVPVQRETKAQEVAERARARLERRFYTWLPNLPEFPRYEKKDSKPTWYLEWEGFGININIINGCYHWCITRYPEPQDPFDERTGWNFNSFEACHFSCARALYGLISGQDDLWQPSEELKVRSLFQEDAQ